MKNRRIVVDRNIPAASECLAGLGEVRLVDGRRLTRSDLTDADALLVRSVTRVDASLLRNTPVSFVGSATSGLDHIDRSFLQDKQVAFAYAPGANANSVVEYVLSAIGAVGDALEQLLAGAKLGVVGYGFVGKILCARLDALEVGYCVYDPWLPEQETDSMASLEDVLACPVITLHPELTYAEPWPSYHLIDQEILAKLDERQLLINASRGAVVDNTALLARFGEAKPPVVVLDVWEDEPIINRELLQCVELGTAHIAGYSLDAKVGGTRLLAQALAQHWQATLPADGEWLAEKSVVNPGEVLDTPQLIRTLLGARYDIRRDDTLLRQAIAQYDTGPAFDLLRSNYRERRELAGSAVSAPCLSKTQKQIVTALGCELVA